MAQLKPDRNALFYGDNLPVLREHIPDETVDLVYLDPPFNSSRTYNVLFRDESGQESEAQIAAFDDTWHWDAATERVYTELATGSNAAVSRMIVALREFIGPNQMMAYLVMMAARLVELHRVLKPTGSLYLHCDPTASHYLKVVLDTIFGPENFRNEVIWRRHSAKGLASTRYASNHDTLLWYTKSDKWIWNTQYREHDPSYVEKSYRYTEEGTGRRYRLDNLANPNKNRPNLTYEFLGITRVWRWTRDRMQAAYEAGLVIQTKPGAVPALKRYLDEQEGTPVDDTWCDISPIQAQASERLGYPTQKPIALLERITLASSNPGGLVLDPFCGCGTAVHAAQKLGRRWMGIDITYLATNLIKNRLRTAFGLEAKRDYDVIGEPDDLQGARHLAEQDGYQFQIWATSLIGAQVQAGAKGADRGIDGAITFIDDPRQKPKRIIIQVKGGHVTSAQVRELIGTVGNEKAEMGIFIALDPPSAPMLSAAASAGFYESKGWGRKYPRVQIITIEQLLGGASPEIPPALPPYKEAQREQPGASQGTLGFG